MPPEHGSGTLERYTIGQDSIHGIHSNNCSFRIQKSGSLEEPEFWTRYNTSVVDAEATKELFEVRKTELKKAYCGKGMSLVFE